MLLDDSEYSVLQQVSLYAYWLRLSWLEKNQIEEKQEDIFLREQGGY